MASAPLNEETTKKVIRQVEFYFSDSNLPKDTFLRNTISESEDGMVSLALICSFSRMRNHLSLGDIKADDISEDTVKSVAETLRTSSMLKVSEDGKKIGRTTEIPKPEEVIEQLDVRTIAASPLEHNVKLEEVESFFGQFAKVNSVRLPRHVADKRLFCGTTLVEFSTEEDATKVLSQSLAYAGVELELKRKKDFDAEREQESEKVENSHSQKGSNRKNSSNGEPNYPKGLIVAFSLKKAAAGDTAEENAIREPANVNVDVPTTDAEPDSTLEDNKENAGTIEKCEEKSDEKTSSETEAEDGKKSQDTTNQNEENKGGREGHSTVEMYKDNNDVVLREDLKSVFQKFGTVKFIDFKIGDDKGYIRYEEAEASQKARAAAALAEEGGLIVKNFIATLDPVTGDAEKEYWSLLQGNQERHRDNKSGNWGRGGKQNRGGRHFNGKRSRNDSSNRPNKALRS